MIDFLLSIRSELGPPKPPVRWGFTPTPPPPADLNPRVTFQATALSKLSVTLARKAFCDFSTGWSIAEVTIETCDVDRSRAYIELQHCANHWPQ